MPNLDRIPEEIADLDTQEVPNIRETARKYKVDRKTLGNRQQGKTTSIVEAVSETHQALTNAQEKALISIINKLTECRIPPTSAIIRNLTEKIRGAPIRKNWISQFINRYKDKLLSKYLGNQESKRIKGEYPPTYKHFFQLVRGYFILLSKV